NTSDKALFRNPVFLKNLQDLESNFEDREQRVLLREVLTVYLDILAHMTHDVKDKNLRHSLNRTRERVAELRQHYFQSKGLLKTHLKELWDIKTGDPLVQRKAIRELKTVFHKASVLGSKKQLPARRRRQASRRHV
ncbi:interferon gamma-like isoform X1, partial [Arapaima gigas]